MGGGAEGTEVSRHIHLILIAGDPVYVHAVCVNLLTCKILLRNFVRKVGTLEFVFGLELQILQVFLLASLPDFLEYIQDYRFVFNDQLPDKEV
ncbi:hypothetical protein V6N11_073171 [Hibiscus sabdariffa]|uniref:Uncharacterized protein n=1 Tax=Hibiscus sabdariffa TaxID=183260 RepID=A0ABR1ZVD4_9ROSI